MLATSRKVENVRLTRKHNIRGGECPGLFSGQSRGQLLGDLSSADESVKSGVIEEAATTDLLR